MRPLGILVVLLLGAAAEPPTRDPVKDHYSFVIFAKDGKEWTAQRRVLDDWKWLWRITWHDGVGYGDSFILSPQGTLLAEARSTSKTWNFKDSSRSRTLTCSSWM